MLTWSSCCSQVSVRQNISIWWSQIKDLPSCNLQLQRGNPLLPSPRHQLETPRRPGNLNSCLVHRPQDPPRGAGKHCWAWPVASAARPWISGRNGCMDGLSFFQYFRLDAIDLSLWWGSEVVFVLITALGPLQSSMCCLSQQLLKCSCDSLQANWLYHDLKYQIVSPIMLSVESHSLRAALLCFRKSSILPG